MLVLDDIWTKDLRQIDTKFVPICWKMTRNQTNLLCGAYKNRPKRKETSIISSEQEMKAGFMVMTQEQSNRHPSAIPESWSRWSQTSRACCLFSWTVRQFFSRIFSSVPDCEPAVLQRSTKGVMEAVGRKCPTSGRHRTGCCIMTTCDAARIHGFFWYLTKKRWW